MHQTFTAIGAPVFDAADFDFADRLRATSLTDDDIRASSEAFGGPADYPKSLHDDILPLVERPGLLFGSTDVGDVSWIVPTAQCLTATAAIGTPFHTCQAVTQGKLPAAHKAMITAAKVMASSGARVIAEADLRQRANQELIVRRNGAPYRSPLPEGSQPPQGAARRG